MKNKTILIIGILILLVSMSFFVLIQEAQEVQAQEQEGCCLETVPVGGVSKQCVITTRAECAGRFYTGPPFDCSNVPDCKPQTCIPKDKSEPCMRNKAAAECAAIGGVPDTRSLEEIPQCKPGCCIIAKGVKAEVLQYRQCENLTKALGYEPDMMEFKEGIVSEIECKKQGSPSDLGCCTLGGGECKYGPRSECTEGSFVPLAGGLFCRDVASCALTSHSYKDCGKLPGTETDIYWFDSQGNQEDMYELCNYPEAMCQKSEIGVVYCKSTRCDLSGALGSQRMSDKPPKVIKEVLPPESLLTGTSICYNFYTHYDGSDEGDEAQDYLQRRSSGLQNQIIHCSFGKPEIEGLGTDRQKLCVPANATVQGPGATFHANVTTNNWQNCSKCGESKKLLGLGNDIGDFLGPAWGIVLPTGKMWSSLFGDYCTKEKCEALGDCYYHQDLGSWLENTPVGSCDPIYPPGQAASRCADCGRGGDALWNLCTRAECYSKGDCRFERAGWLRKFGMFNWYWPGLAFSERISLIIPECIWTTLYCKAKCTPPPVCEDIACYHPSNQEFFRCLADRSKNYAVGIVPWVVKETLIEAAWNALKGEVTNTIISEGKKAIFGGGGQQQGGQGGGS